MLPARIGDDGAQEPAPPSLLLLPRADCIAARQVIRLHFVGPMSGRRPQMRWDAGIIHRAGRPLVVGALMAFYRRTAQKAHVSGLAAVVL